MVVKYFSACCHGVMIQQVKDSLWNILQYLSMLFQKTPHIFLMSACFVWLKEHFKVRYGTLKNNKLMICAEYLIYLIGCRSQMSASLNISAASESAVLYEQSTCCQQDLTFI